MDKHLYVFKKIHWWFVELLQDQEKREQNSKIFVWNKNQWHKSHHISQAIATHFHQRYENPMKNVWRSTSHWPLPHHPPLFLYRQNVTCQKVMMKSNKESRKNIEYLLPFIVCSTESIMHIHLACTAPYRLISF